MSEVEITVKVNIEEGIEILNKLLQMKGRAKKKTIDEWPYHCWNCTQKLEENDAVKKGDVLECPHCGIQIPEP